MLKRGHLQTVSYGQRLVKEVRGMTAARFDLLYVLLRVPPPTRPHYRPRRRWSRADREHFDETQASLTRKLGLHRSTVSKMLQRLEDMGWIARTRCEEDRRTFIVSLTAKGQLEIGRATDCVLRTQKLRKAYELLFAPKEPEEPWDLWASGRWKGDHASVGAASDALREARSRPGYDPFAGQKPAVVVLDEIYGTLRTIAQWFGDRSNLWFDLGEGRPAHA